jgi:hypothetical protein
VRGAVISGIENSDNATPLKACPKNYGICLTEDFSGVRDNWDDRYTDNPTSRVMATGQMYWLIMKGDLLMPTEAREANKDCPFTFSEHDSRQFKFNIYEYAYDDVPQRYQNAADGMFDLQKPLLLYMLIISLQSSLWYSRWMLILVAYRWSICSDRTTMVVHTIPLLRLVG